MHEARRDRGSPNLLTVTTVMTPAMASEAASEPRIIGTFGALSIA